MFENYLHDGNLNEEEKKEWNETLTLKQAALNMYKPMQAQTIPQVYNEQISSLGHLK